LLDRRQISPAKIRVCFSNAWQRLAAHQRAVYLFPSVQLQVSAPPKLLSTMDTHNTPIARVLAGQHNNSYRKSHALCGGSLNVDQKLSMLMQQGLVVLHASKWVVLPTSELCQYNCSMQLQSCTLTDCLWLLSAKAFGLLVDRSARRCQGPCCST